MLNLGKFGTSLCFAISFAATATYYYQIEKKEHSALLALNTDTIVETAYEFDSAVVRFLSLATSENKTIVNNAISYIDSNWKEGYEIMLMESIYFNSNQKTSNRLLHLLERKTNKKFGFDFDKWFQWIWKKNPSYTDEYYEFKAEIHKRIDSKFNTYFLGREDQSTIRLDEVRWGGVIQDGIPPLRGPKMITSKEANYLKDSNVIFGIEVNGDARAYPKRILAWHEMFVDTVGDVPVAGVYCTLCGTVILYKTEHKGVSHEIGTSGFLYRSNKLMYDKATQSLWSTLEGEPIIGPLVGKGIKLEYLSVVTTTWGEWKKRHPETKVLSLDTGHQRNYGEGVAYKDYFSTDELMFTIPEIDRSLKNKDEILSIRLPDVPDENYAISSKFLRQNSVYNSKIGNVSYTVFTDKTGAHRVFKTGKIKFKEYDKIATVKDTNGVIWKVSEEKMTSTIGEVLERFPTHNAFWFGYKAAFPNTILID